MQYLEDYTFSHIEKTLANITFEDDSEDISSLTTNTEDGRRVNIYQKQNLGKGNIVLYNFDLGDGTEGRKYPSKNLNKIEVAINDDASGSSVTEESAKTEIAATSSQKEYNNNIGGDNAGDSDQNGENVANSSEYSRSVENDTSSSDYSENIEYSTDNIDYNEDGESESTKLTSPTSQTILYRIILTSSIMGNLPTTAQTRLTTEISGTSIPYSITNSMSYTDTENIPRVAPYITIIVIYILIIGPVSYLILGRKDKHGLIWIVVPVMAVAFTGIMYAAGSKTRVEEPFVGYVEMRTFNENKIVEDELYFSLTAPYNDNYTVKLGPHYDNIKLMDIGNEFPQTNQHQVDIDPNKYTAAVNYGTNKTILEVSNNPAFTPVFFEASNEYIGSNPLIADIHYTGDIIEGTITNTSNYTITNAMYIGDAFLFNIGTIYNGQTLDIGGLEKYYIHDITDIYSSEVIDKVIYGGSPKTGITPSKEDLTSYSCSDAGNTNRKREILYYLVDKHLSSAPYENCIIGFNQSGKDAPFIEEISEDLEVHGTKAIMSHVSVDYSKDGAELVPSIAPLVQNGVKTGLGMKGDYPVSVYPTAISEEETIIEYYLPKDEEILSVEYYALSNQAPLSEYNTAFVGRIYAMNRQTGEFDHIFTANASKNEDTTLIRNENVEDYLTNDNILTLKYEPTITQMDSIMLLPNISYWKEAD